jgi:hypothetical protein
MFQSDHQRAGTGARRRTRTHTFSETIPAPCARSVSQPGNCALRLPCEYFISETIAVFMQSTRFANSLAARKGSFHISLPAHEESGKREGCPFWGCSLDF